MVEFGTGTYCPNRKSDCTCGSWCSKCDAPDAHPDCRHYNYTGAGGCIGGCSSSDCCNCLAADCVLTVLEGGAEARRTMGKLRAGDVVRTGSRRRGERHRRVARVWASPAGVVDVVDVAPGCRLTPGHPALAGGRWVRAAALGPARPSLERVVYGVELEGHVDTVLVGGAVVVAGIGANCFGWNIFTRKSLRCDRATCAACDVCVDPTIDFANVAVGDLDRAYAPVPRPPPLAARSVNE